MKIATEFIFSRIARPSDSFSKVDFEQTNTCPFNVRSSREIYRCFSLPLSHSSRWTHELIALVRRSLFSSGVSRKRTKACCFGSFVHTFHVRGCSTSPTCVAVVVCMTKRRESYLLALRTTKRKTEREREGEKERKREREKRNPSQKNKK